MKNLLLLLLAWPLLAAAQEPTLDALRRQDNPPDDVPTVAGSAAPQSFPAPATLKTRLLLPLPGTDLDGDGLSDEGEAELAQTFRPYLVFDSHENALRAAEPGTLFQVRPVGCAGPRSRCGGKPLVLRVVFLNLWQWDGGYGRSSNCKDRHIGDNQAVSLDLESKDDGHTLRITAIHNGVFHWPKNSGDIRLEGGTHPWIYFSAGKHHQFFDTLLNGQDSPYSKWGCNDGIDGKGVRFLARLSTAGDWNNVGEPERLNAAKFVDALDKLGFPGERAWATTPFCGGLACKNNPTSHNADFWSRELFDLPSPKGY